MELLYSQILRIRIAHKFPFPMRKFHFMKLELMYDDFQLPFEQCFYFPDILFFQVFRDLWNVRDHILRFIRIPKSKVYH